MKLLNIIGLKVLCIKGDPVKGRKKNPRIEPAYILFEDGETIATFETQDAITYRDFDSRARTLAVIQDKIYWNRLKEFYPDANTDF